VLCRNAELNPGKVRIVPLMVAATPSDGPIEFEYSDAGFCNGGRHEGVSPWRHGHAFKLKVQGRNLESLLMSDYPDLLPRIRYIKVDAEGYDHSVLLSVRNILRATRPFLMAEVFKWTDRAQREAFVRFLQQEGYDVFHVRGDADYRGEPVGPEDVMRWPHYDIFCVPITRPPR
jgi:FkbM family methyltransferase